MTDIPWRATVGTWVLLIHDDDDDSNLSAGRMFTATDVMQTVKWVSEMKWCHLNSKRDVNRIQDCKLSQVSVHSVNVGGQREERKLEDLSVDKKANFWSSENMVGFVTLKTLSWELKKRSRDCQQYTQCKTGVNTKLTKTERKQKWNYCPQTQPTKRKPFPV